MRRIISNLVLSAVGVLQFKATLIIFTILATPSLHAKEPSRLTLPGYKAVPVRYGPLNEMLMSVSINGHSANLIVDTGAKWTNLDSNTAESFGVAPSRHGLRYFGFTTINGQVFPLGFVRTFSAGPMNFGGTVVALFTAGNRDTVSSRTSSGNLHVDGVLGRDILVRHKAVINSRTKLVFFKVEPSAQLRLASFALSQHFTRVPMQQEANGAFTVPCSINGRRSSLLVDTGAFVTTLNAPTMKALGITLQPTQAKARFTTGLVRPISVGQINDLTIGEFRVPPMKLAAAALPNFALRQGGTPIDGILGLELLVICHGIIDLHSSSLFLK